MSTRRNFVTGAAAAIALPRAGRAQTESALPRVAVLMNTRADDLQGKASMAAFTRGLADRGRTVGRDLRIDVFWGENSFGPVQKCVADIVALKPDAVLAAGTMGVTALKRATDTVPIVFVRVADPLGSGIIDSVDRPGGNATGFMLFEFTLSGKWLEVLRQIQPEMKRVAVLRDASNPAGIGQFSVIQALAQSVGLQVSPIGVRDASEIERGMAALAGLPNGGLIVTPSATSANYRDLIIALAARHRVPAVYANDFDASRGGLISYGPDRVDQFRQAAEYIDRILKGEKPADLPVQAPTKFKLVVNNKTATVLGLALPQAVLARADEVIE